MNLKRGILIGIVLYLATLIIGVIITILTKANLSTPQNAPTAYWIITIITTVVLTGLASVWYFNKSKRNTKEGLKLGVVFVLTGFVIDILLFMTQKNGLELVKEYYSKLAFYIIIGLVIATCAFIGSQENSKSKEETNKKHKRK